MQTSPTPADCRSKATADACTAVAMAAEAETDAETLKGLQRAEYLIGVNGVEAGRMVLGHEIGAEMDDVRFTGRRAYLNGLRLAYRLTLPQDAEAQAS